MSTLSTSEYYLVQASPDGKLIAGAAYNRQLPAFHLRIWDETGKTLIDLNGNTAPLLDIAWSPDSRRIAGSDGNFDLNIWCLDLTNDNCTFGEIITNLGRDGYAETGLDWNVYDQLVAVSDFGTFSVIVWDMAAYKELYKYNGGENTAVSWSPDGLKLAIGGRYGAVSIIPSDLSISALDAAKFVINPENDISITSVQWDRTGDRLAYGQQDGTVIIVDGETYRELDRLQQHTNAVYALAWSFDNARLATASATGTVVIWNSDDNTTETIAAIKQDTSTYGISWISQDVLLYPDDSDLPVGLPNRMANQ